MKTFAALAALAMVQASSAVATATTAPQAVVDIKSEFLRWKTSAAGQLAYKNGFVPVRATTSANMSLMNVDEPTQDELTRFQNSIDALSRMQAKQPLASFSIDTPFALLTNDEFAAYVKKSGAQAHMAEMKQRVVPQTLPTEEGAAVTSTNTTGATVATIDYAALAAATSIPTNASSTVNVNANLNANDTRKLSTWAVNVDWQTKGCVTRVKDQGSCGVCWAFASTGALESGYCVQTGKLYELSEQEVVSCSRSQPSCDGYNSAGAYDWLTRMNGGSICTEKSYPYVSGGGTAPSCKRYSDPSFKCEKPILGAYFYGGGDFGDHTQLEAAVLKQPVAMSIAAVGDAFQYYKGGVLMGDEKNCPVDKVNHEVLIVGFGTLDGVPYWKIKNQWTEAWGDHGYMYIERGYQGHTYGACGVEKYGFYPVFAAASDARLGKRTTQPRWGYAVSGQTIKTIPGVWLPSQCANRCLGESACVAFNMNAGAATCELKSTNTGLVRASLYSGSVISTAESLTKCSPIASNTDYPGNDLRATTAVTTDECCDHCDAHDDCNAFTWSKFNGGMCYLKTQGPAKPVVASPDSDGSAYLKSAVKYKCQPLQANTDRPGYDLGSAPSATAANCCGICRSTDDCYGFSWTDYNGGTCWLKKIGSGSATASGVTSATVY